MALGLVVGSPMIQPSEAQNGNTSRRLGESDWEREELLSDLAAAIMAFAASKQIDPLVRTRIHDGQLLVSFHPAAEDIKFSFKKDWVECHAVTSSVGPGYHAAVVEMLKQIAAPTGLSWSVEDPQRGYRDDTGYWQRQDFADLQVAMARHLTKLAGFLMTQADSKNIQLSIPVGFPMPVADFFAMSPMGFWERDIFENAAKGDARTLAKVCESFFPWWKQGIDAEFWRNAGLCLVWTEIPWHPPVNDEERAIYAKALRCFQRAYELDKSIALPKNEMAEMAMFVEMDVNTPAPVPKNDGKGFWRYNLRRPLSGSWSAEFPGYFYAGNERDGDTALFWHNGMVMRVRSYDSLEELSRYNPGLNVEKLSTGDGDGKADKGQGEDKKVSLVSDIEKANLLGRAYLVKARDEEGEYWSLEGRVLSPDGACIITLTFPPNETHLKWAKEVFESVDRAA